MSLVVHFISTEQSSLENKNYASSLSYLFSLTHQSSTRKLELYFTKASSARLDQQHYEFSNSTVTGKPFFNDRIQYYKYLLILFIHFLILFLIFSFSLFVYNQPDFCLSVLIPYRKSHTYLKSYSLQTVFKNLGIFSVFSIVLNKEPGIE